MADGYKTPPELVDYMIKTGIDKATKPLFKSTARRFNLTSFAAST